MNVVASSVDQKNIKAFKTHLYICYGNLELHKVNFI